MSRFLKFVGEDKFSRKVLEGMIAVQVPLIPSLIPRLSTQRFHRQQAADVNPA